MKFWAKVRLKGGKNAECLIRSFFKEFNSESSIVIRGNEAKLEIVFDEPPMRIIEAINYCDVIEFIYGKKLGEYKEDENEQIEQAETYEQIEQAEQAEAGKEIPEQAEQLEAGEETSEQAEQTEASKQKKSEKAKKVSPKKSKISSKNVDEIPELEKLAKKSSSFENFVESVANWLEMDKRTELFQSIIRAAEQAKKISWNNIEALLNSDGITYSRWDKICCMKLVANKFKNSKNSVTIMKLIKAVIEYKTYDFNSKVREENSEQTEQVEAKEEFSEQTEQAETEVENVEQTESVEEEETSEQAVSNEKVDDQTETVNVEVAEPKNRVKMECMPEIPQFEEFLGSVDKTRPIEERVDYVLTAMGLKKLEAKEQREIFEMTNTAVRLGRMSFDIIFLRAKIPMEESMTARMTLSKFINDFVKEYSDKKVKLLDFLKDLQNIIMFESEIESFSDFTD